MRTAWLAILASWFVLGCGGGGTPTTQPAARDQASTAACNYYARCMMVGAGLRFTSNDDCLTQVKAYFEGAWPPATCNGVSPTGINNCIAAINISDCGSGADAFNVVFNKCTAANVCASGADAAGQ